MEGGLPLQPFEKAASMRVSDRHTPWLKNPIPPAIKLIFLFPNKPQAESRAQWSERQSPGQSER